MKQYGVGLLVVVSFLFSVKLLAEPIDIDAAKIVINGEHVQVMQELAGPVDMAEAMTLYKQGLFYPAREGFLNFGIGAQPVWIHFDVNNSASVSLKKRLSVKTSWLDQLSVYIFHDDLLINSYQLGDGLPFSQRLTSSRYFEVDHGYKPGITSVLLRVETPDPMVLPVYLYDSETAHADEIFESYTYAFVYGILFALAVYNLILYFTLKAQRYFYYTIYLASFLLMNLAYTGHGYQLFWSDSPGWQLWSNPILMVLFAVCGLVFATTFLNTRRLLPRYHRWVVIISLAIVTSILLSLAFNSPVSALLIAFTTAFFYGLIVVLLGAISLYSGNRSAKFFLIASVTHVSTAIITAMTVWGIVPYSTFGFHAVEFGMSVDAILLSIALSDQLRIINKAKLDAERLAMTDHLTGINNRRAFYELVKPLWNTGIRKHRDMSVLIMDIDKFKLINDKHGHAIGDRVIRLLGRTLSENARAGDVIARWGGEEFILFLPETNLYEATEFAERFREMIATQRIMTDKENVMISISLGIAHKADSEMSIDDLIDQADKYLFKAKEAGRNRVCTEYNCG